MSFHVEQLDEEPIILITLSSDFDPYTEGDSLTDQILSLLDQQPEPVYYITDFSNIRLSLEQLLYVASFVARGEKPVLHHPKIRCAILVTSDAMLSMSAQGLDSAVFGNVHMEVFSSLDDALDRARS